MFDIYLLETIVNGILLGGVLALLALGLNLIFGVIDVVWICYAELVMLGMYAIFYLYVKFHIPLILACLAGIAVVAVVGYLVHFLIISPILGSAPINQLLATGGLLFFLQSFATLLFGIEFRNIGLRLPVLEVFGMYISFAGMVTFKKSHELRQIAQQIPTDRILVETDSPYLTPHPHRGKRPNEPAMIVHTAECLAEARGVPLDQFAAETTANAQRLFQFD